jgi:hypothetical protein
MPTLTRPCLHCEGAGCFADDGHDVSGLSGDTVECGHCFGDGMVDALCDCCGDDAHRFDVRSGCFVCEACDLASFRTESRGWFQLVAWRAAQVEQAEAAE